MYLKIVLPVLLSLITGVIGYFIRHFIERKRALADEATKKRRELYQEFVNILLDTFGKGNNKETDISELGKKLDEFYKSYVLYASPRVINAMSDLFQHFYSAQKSTQKGNGAITIKKAGNVIKEMRKDLGLNNKGLGRNGERLFRATLNDFDEVF
jgi:hypothetical protein